MEECETEKGEGGIGGGREESESERERGMRNLIMNEVVEEHYECEYQTPQVLSPLSLPQAPPSLGTHHVLCTSDRGGYC